MSGLEDTPCDNAFTPDENAVSIDQRHARFFAKNLHLPGQLPGSPPVIAIQESQEFAPSFADSAILRGWLSPIVVIKIPNPVAVRFRYAASVVCRAVVNDQDFLV